jgi:hypothetical protein
VSEAQRMRDKAAQAFRLASGINDPEARKGLEALGREFEAKAAELERQGKSRGEQKPISQNDTP